jgi:hypothetical protein
MVRLLKLGIFHWPYPSLTLVPWPRETPLISLNQPEPLPLPSLLAARAVIVTSHRGGGKTWHKSRKRANERPCHSIPGMHTHNIPRTGLWNLCPGAAILVSVLVLVLVCSSLRGAPEKEVPASRLHCPHGVPRDWCFGQGLPLFISLVRGFGIGVGTTTHYSKDEVRPFLCLFLDFAEAAAPNPHYPFPQLREAHARDNATWSFSGRGVHYRGE